ncbi:hypothetical protein SAMN05444285_1242 [Draconibacterium orientale]|jgi:hypothetical protein|uniref:Uncharacterized protein n=1 Tax=Draconibacterium orientale TaxID=1168034 RepID=A0A1I0H9C6_9BACT|nr:hypothetical protein SAMN05444285_1242 [Draconibacterium orientale]
MKKFIRAAVWERNATIIMAIRTLLPGAIETIPAKNGFIYW